MAPRLAPRESYANPEEALDLRERAPPGIRTQNLRIKSPLLCH